MEKKESNKIVQHDIDTNSALSSKTKTIVAAATQITISQCLMILGLIFGGCCSNVFTLESIISETPHSGTAITFFQFLVVALEGYLSFFDLRNEPIKHLFLPIPKVPIKRSLVAVVLFFLVSVLNNYVWIFKISIPVHIIFRSSGTVTTMLVGYCFGRRYNKLQITSATILSIGVILATIANQSPNNSSSITSSLIDEETEKSDYLKFIFGIFILFIAAILSALMGVYSETTFQKYGKHWKEQLFYTHFLALPFFLPMTSTIISQFKDIWFTGRPLIIQLPFINTSFQISYQFFLLILNGITQYFCVRGVNMLAGNTSALTVTIILNLRKFTSLIISMIMFGNELSAGAICGTTLVFGSALLYSYASSQKKAVVDGNKKKVQ